VQSNKNAHPSARVRA